MDTLEGLGGRLEATVLVGGGSSLVPLRSMDLLFGTGPMSASGTGTMLGPDDHSAWSPWGSRCWV